MAPPAAPHPLIAPLATHTHTLALLLLLATVLPRLTAAPTTALPTTLAPALLLHGLHLYLTPAPKRSSLFLTLCLTLAIGTPAAYAVLVLFGAPFTSHVAETAGAAAHLASLAWMLVYRRGGMEAVGGVAGAAGGAWFGAVPIALDWDREWQRWPVTIVVGAYCGFLVGRTVGWGYRARKMPVF